jgi:hypothetical protein
LVSADEKDAKAEVRKFLKEAGADFDSYQMSEAPDTFIHNWEPRWGATLPATFILDGKGKQVTFWIGKTNRQELETKVKSLLAAKSKN